MRLFLSLIIFFSVVQTKPVYSSENFKNYLQNLYENFCRKHRFQYVGKNNRCCPSVISAYTQITREMAPGSFVVFDVLSGGSGVGILFEEGSEEFTILKRGDYIIRFLGVARAEEVSVQIVTSFDSKLPVPTYSSLDLSPTNPVVFSIPVEGIVRVERAPQTIKVRLFNSNHSPIVLNSGSSLTIQQVR